MNADARLGRATGPVVELLEGRQLLSGTPHLAESSPVVAFNTIAAGYAGAATSRVETLTLTNTGDAPLALGAGSVSVVADPIYGAGDASDFVIDNAGSLPAALAPGQSATLALQFTAPTPGLHGALLQLQTNDPATPTVNIDLHGLGTTGTGGANEPSLAAILRAYDIPTIVGDGANDANAFASTFYPATPDASSQEVAMQRLTKAGAGPVTIQTLASFAVTNSPAARVGFYTPGTTNDRTELFTIGKNDSQTVNPTALGATSFDPGYKEFGLYSVFPTFTDNGHQRVSYSEDALNTWDAAVPRKVRFFPLENKDGSVVPNAYVFAFEDNNVFYPPNIQPYDSNDVVGIIRNVRPASNAANAPAIGLENLDGAPFNDRMIFNRISITNPTQTDVVHNTGTLRIRNTGSAPLQITSVALSDTNHWLLTNLPKTPFTIAAGQSFDLQVKFIANTNPAHTDNQTNDTTTFTSPYLTPQQAGGVWNANLVITSNDPAASSKTVQLAGYWQYQSEHEDEPGLQTIINRMAGYQTVISNQYQPNYPEGQTTPAYFGEEVTNAFYWQQADGSTPMNVIQLAAFHQQLDSTNNPTHAQFGWYRKGATWPTYLFNQAAANGQSVLPQSVTGGVAQTSVSVTGTFGWALDGNYSDDTLNTTGTGGGHHVRFYPVRDESGNLVPNEYLACLDYGSTSFENFDFQDDVYLITNAHPVNRPAAPTDLQAFAGAAGGVALQWAPVSDSTLAGYNIYAGTSPTGTMTKLNASPVTGTSYIDPTATPGTTTYYEIRAVDSNGESVGAGASASAIPAAPATLIASAIDAGHVQLNWTASAGAVTYRIERAPVGGSFVEIAGGVAGTAFVDATAVGNTSYVYQIRAENSGGLSGYTQCSSAVTTPPAVPPGAPGAVGVSNATSSSITLSWAPAVGAVTFYHVERQGPGDAQFVQVATTTGTSFTDTGLSPDAGYQYRVRAENAGSFSNYDTSVSAATLPIPPQQPATLSQAKASVGVSLQWTVPAGVISDYLVERFGPSDKNYVVIAKIVGNSYTDTNVTPYDRYRYRVVAENAAGQAPASNVITATAPEPAGGSMSTAYNLNGIPTTTKKLRQTLTPADGQVYYVFQVNTPTKLTLNLSNVKDRTLLELLDSKGNVLKSLDTGRRHGGTLTMLISTGRYYLKTQLLGANGTAFTLAYSGKPMKVKVKHSRSHR